MGGLSLLCWNENFFLLDPYFGHPQDGKALVKKRCGHEERSQGCPLAYSWQRVLGQMHKWDHGGSHFLCSSPLCLETRAPWGEPRRKWGETRSSAGDRPSANPRRQQHWRCRALTPGRPERLPRSLQQSAVNLVPSALTLPPYLPSFLMCSHVVSQVSCIILLWLPHQINIMTALIACPGQATFSKQ